MYRDDKCSSRSSFTGGCPIMAALFMTRVLSLSKDAA
jgi:hypothetical protein